MSPVAHKPSLNRMGIQTGGVVNVSSFTRDNGNSWTRIETPPAASYAFDVMIVIKARGAA